ncbi:MAG: TonB family protein [Parvibaculum sp.]
MTDLAAGRVGFDPETRKRWSRSFIVALGLHAALLAFLANWVVQRVTPEAPPPAIMIDMMAMPPAPEQPTSTEPDVSVPKKTDTRPEQLPMATKAEAVVKKSPPVPKPVRAEPQKVAPRSAPTASSSAPTAPALAASPVEAKPAVAPNYLSVLFEHLERYKRYPRVFGARRVDLVALVHVKFDRAGQILSLAIERSSGSATYDKAALSTFHRAEPLPPFPASMTQATLSLDVPVRFTRSD